MHTQNEKENVSESEKHRKNQNVIRRLRSLADTIMPNLQKSRVTPILDTTIWIENEGDIWQVFVQIDCECNGEGCGGNIGASPKIMGKQTPDLVADYTRVALIDALMTKKENVKNQSRSEANGLLRAVMSAIRDGEAEVVGVSRTKKEPVKH